MNEDVEVVHYATKLMLAELHKEYDLKIQELKALLKQPDDIDIWRSSV